MYSSSAFAADGEYYTWVDAQGRIHNTPVEDKSSTSESAIKQDEPPSTPPGDTTEYITEEQLQRNLDQYDEDNPAFYVWVDANGVMHTERFDSKAESEAVQSEAVDDSEAVVGWSPILAPPFRVSDEVTSGACCETFSDQFEPVLESYKSVQLFDPTRYRSFITGMGNRPAWYFHIGNQPDKSSGQRFLVLRVRGAEISGTLIALNSEYKPLHLELDVEMGTQAETWRSVAYQEAKVLIEDPEVVAFIFYPDLKPAEDLSLEIRWADGTSPF
ncbi:MAG: hypothetical protein ABNH15_12495 [Alcanivorax sp.]|jgi:hypothetical protein|nr:MAG: hypothetical protein COA68_01845 [Oceanobacter sp.]